MTRAPVLLVTLSASFVALAQQTPIRWFDQPRPAVAEAQRSVRPLIVYVLAGTKDRDNDIERDHRAALNSPEVLRVAQYFVPLRLSRSAHRDVLADFGLRESSNMEMSFVAPNGEILGRAGVTTISRPEALAKQLAQAFAAFRDKLYEADIKPVLTKADAKPAELKLALERVANMRLTMAEADVLALLQRENLIPAVRQDVLETLAVLSTPEAIKALLQLPADDRQVTRALAKTTPVGAEHMLEGLRADAPQFDYALYETIAKVSNLPSPKPARYFENAELRMKEEEVERLRNHVRRAAERWKAMYELPD